MVNIYLPSKQSRHVRYVGGALAFVAWAPWGGGQLSFRDGASFRGIPSGTPPMSAAMDIPHSHCSHLEWTCTRGHA